MWIAKAGELYNLALATKIFIRSTQGHYIVCARLEGEHVMLFGAPTEPEARDYMEKLLLRLNGKARR